MRQSMPQKAKYKDLAENRGGRESTLGFQIGSGSGRLGLAGARGARRPELEGGAAGARGRRRLGRRGGGGGAGVGEDGGDGGEAGSARAERRRWWRRTGGDRHRAWRRKEAGRVGEETGSGGLPRALRAGGAGLPGVPRGTLRVGKGGGGFASGGARGTG